MRHIITFILICLLFPTISFSQQEVTSTARKGSSIKATPYVDGETLLKLEEETEITITGWEKNYFKVCAGEVCGYMSEIWVNKRNQDVLDLRHSERARIKRESYTRAMKDIIEEDDYMREKYGEETFLKLKKRHYWIGMNKEMLRFSLGKPDRINSTQRRNGRREQWVYGNTYIYVENDKVVSYQN